MKPEFRSSKSTQIASLFLKLGGGQMYYIKLVKLMYIADRTALERWGRSLTFDRYVSMKNGMVLSGTYDLIKGETADKYWSEHISPREDNQVSLITEPEYDEISEINKDLIAEIFHNFGHWDRFKLADYTHSLPEYKQTDGPALDVYYEEVLTGIGKSPEETKDVLEDLESIVAIEKLAHI